MTAHYVEAFLDDSGLNGWQCFTCGTESTGIRGWALAEKLGGIHVRTAAGMLLTARPPAPDLSPAEREIVDRFEAASDPFACDCGHDGSWHGLPASFGLPTWCEACDCRQFEGGAA